MSQFPLFYVFLFSEYGKNMVVTLAKHYPDPGDTINRQQLLDEWQKAKYDLLQWKENDLPKTFAIELGWLQLQNGACQNFHNPPTILITQCFALMLKSVPAAQWVMLGLKELLVPWNDRKAG